MKKGMNLVFQSIATVCVIVILTFAVLNFFSAPEKKGLFGYKGFIVLSDSMQPAFAAGDYIINQVTPFEEVKLGDTITYLDAQEVVVTHRVVGEEAGELLLKGDGNDFTDQTLVNTENYVGKHRYTIPKLGSLMVKLSQPLVLVGISLLFLVLLIYNEFKRN